MFNRLRELIKNQQKEKFLVPVVVTVAILLAMWVAEKDSPKESDSEISELSTTIPKGMLVVPLELANGSALSALISRNAIVDIFQAGEHRPLVENLRIIKLNAGDGPLFGALVPEKLAGGLQDAFSHPKLKAAIRTLNSGPTSYHLKDSSRSLLTEIAVGE